MTLYWSTPRFITNAYIALLVHSQDAEFEAVIGAFVSKL